MNGRSELTRLNRSLLWPNLDTGREIQIFWYVNKIQRYFPMAPLVLSIIKHNVISSSILEV